MRNDNTRKFSHSVDLDEVVASWESARQAGGGGLQSRIQHNVDTRLAWWSGQTRDGKKHSDAYGYEVFPWENASDARVPLVDMYAIQDVSMLMSAWRQVRMHVNPTEIRDAGWAGKVSAYLNWQMRTNIPNFDFEMELAANYLVERGSAVMGTFWERARQLEYRVVESEEILTLVQQARAAVVQADQAGIPIPEEYRHTARLVEYIQDPSDAGDQAMVEIVLPRLLPDLRSGQAQNIIRQIRKNGRARFPYPYVKTNRPKVVAMSFGDEVFLTPGVGTILDAQDAFRVEHVSESDLLDRRDTAEYSASWVQAVIDSGRGMRTQNQTTRGRVAVDQIAGRRADDETFEIVHRWSRQHDQHGVPVIAYTVFHSSIRPDGGADRVAVHDFLNYDHGEIPLTLWRRECRTRRVEESRGLGEVLDDSQNALKREWDSQADRASIATLPPSYEPEGEEVDRFGPGVRITTSFPDGYGFFRPPPVDRGTDKVEMARREFANEYMGRSGRPERAAYEASQRQSLVDKWLIGAGSVGSQILALCQQFENDQIFFRVVGTNQGRALQTTRQEIQGRFDVGVNFNAARLDPEYVDKYLERIERLFKADATGRIDRDAALEVIAEVLDYGLAEHMVQSRDTATTKAMEKVEEDYLAMWAGIPRIAPATGGAEFRLRKLDELIQRNPEAIQKIQNKDAFGELVLVYRNQLQHQIDQSRNAVIGVHGDMPNE